MQNTKEEKYVYLDASSHKKETVKLALLGESFP